MRDRWCGREAVIALDVGLNAIRREHFERGALRGRGRGVRIFADVKGAADVLAFAVFADGLRGRENVRLGERAVQRRAAMAARAEADELVGVRRVRLEFVVAAFELADID